MNSLRLILPGYARDTLRNIIFTTSSDRFIWKLSSDGVFSTKVLFTKYYVNVPVIPWAKNIWKPWIPPKISCFLWKIFLNVIPTDKNIIRLGLPLVSKCRCCLIPDVEDSNHLLFSGEAANKVWCFMSRLFMKPRPWGVYSLNRTWFSGKKRCFMDCFAAGMAGCALWEIWKFRNAITYDGKPGDILWNIRQWASKIILLIKAPYVPSFHNDSLLAACKASMAKAPHLPNRPAWLAWRAADHGLTLNFAFGGSPNQYNVAGIIRNSVGGFVCAFRLPLRQASIINEVDEALVIARQSCGARVDSVVACQSSHPGFLSLAGSEPIMPNDLYMIRRIRRDYSFRFLRITPAQNGTAICILFTMPDGYYSTWSDLTLAVRCAIRADKYGLPAPPSFNHTLRAGTSMDDIRYRVQNSSNNGSNLSSSFNVFI